MEGRVRLHIYLSDDLHKKLKAWCSTNGRTMQSAAVEMISRVVETRLPSGRFPPAAQAPAPQHLAVPNDDRFLMPGMRAAPTAPAPAAQKPPQKTPRELELEKRNYFRGLLNLPPQTMADWDVEIAEEARREVEEAAREAEDCRLQEEFEREQLAKQNGVA